MGQTIRVCFAFLMGLVLSDNASTTATTASLLSPRRLERNLSTVTSSSSSSSLKSVNNMLHIESEVSKEGGETSEIIDERRRRLSFRGGLMPVSSEKAEKNNEIKKAMHDRGLESEPVGSNPSQLETQNEGEEVVAVDTTSEGAQQLNAEVESEVESAGDEINVNTDSEQEELAETENEEVRNNAESIDVGTNDETNTEEEDPTNLTPVPNGSNAPVDGAANINDNDKCVDATASCTDCLAASETVKTESGGAKLCRWVITADTAGECQLMDVTDAAETNQESMCPPDGSGTGNNIPDGQVDGNVNSGGNEIIPPAAGVPPVGEAPVDDDDEGGSSFTLVVVLIVLALGGVGAFYVRKKLQGGKGHGSSFADASDLQSVFTTGGMSTASSRTKYENLPQSVPDDDEEWGWEDNSELNDHKSPTSTGSLEMASSSSFTVHRNTSTGRSTSSSSNSSTTASRLTPASRLNISKIESPVVSARKTTPSISDDWDSDWDEPATTTKSSAVRSTPAAPLSGGSRLSPAVSKPVTPAPSINRPSPAIAAAPSSAPPLSTSAPSPSLQSVMPMTITSLGTSSASSSNKKKKPVKKKSSPDDDLFASMGLSAKPTFQAPTPSTHSKPSSMMMMTTTATTSSSSWKTPDLKMNTASTSGGGGGGGDWDDGDLDDLLDD